MESASEQASIPPVNPNPAPSPINGQRPPVEHQFRPGHSGNKGGRPAGASFLNPWLRKLAANPNEYGEGKLAEEAATRAIAALLAGDKDTVKAFLDSMDRTDGPIVKEHAVAYTQVKEGLTLVKMDGPPPPLPVEET